MLDDAARPLHPDFAMRVDEQVGHVRPVQERIERGHEGGEIIGR
jgi:hypothetical protein